VAKPNLKSVPRRLHVKTGDTVIVISGRSKDLLRNENSTQTGDKGKIGKVLKVFPKTVNPQGEVVEREMPIFSSKVMLWDEGAGKPTRVRKEIRDGKKVRISVVSGNEI